MLTVVFVVSNYTTKQLIYIEYFTVFNESILLYIIFASVLKY